MTLRYLLNRFRLKEPYHGCFSKKALREAKEKLRSQNKLVFFAKRLKSRDDTLKMIPRGARRA